MTRWQWSRFGELKGSDVYEALALRQRVFGMEQKILYLDPDGKDRYAWHLLGWTPAEDGTERLSAYLRALPPGVKYAELAIGRVVVAPEYRGAGLGRELMHEAFRRIEGSLGPSPIRISAQAYLERFYQSLGFKTVSEPYVEEGIDHIEMLRPLSPSLR